MLRFIKIIIWPVATNLCTTTDQQSLQSCYKSH